MVIQAINMPDYDQYLKARISFRLSYSPVAVARR